MEKYTTHELGKAIETNTSWHAVAKALSLNASGGGVYPRLKRLASEHGFDTSHFSGRAWNRGKSSPQTSHPKYTTEQLFVTDSTVARCVIRRRIIKHNLLEMKCAICGLSDVWHGKRIELILDHVNGDNKDHRLENLRFVCPNCNSQLPTFAGRNKKTGDDSGSRTHTVV